MAKINVPEAMLAKDSLKTLPAKEKEEYIGNFLRKVLEMNPEGITISQIRDATGYTYSTLWHHLEILSCTAQSHKISHGNVDVYFPSGKGDDLKELKKGTAKYSISVVKDREGEFVCIYEKRLNRLGNQTVCKGIPIPIELIDDLIKTLEKIKKTKK